MPTTLTPVQDTVYDPDGVTLFSGTIAIGWIGPVPEGETRSQLSATANVYNGALSLLLVPNNSGTNYQAAYTTSDGTETWTERWFVPASSTPLTLSQIRVASQPMFFVVT